MADQGKPVLENSSGPIAFQTEIQQLLNILIHSLYSNREIFLRELLSNASDALTQMRYIQQTDRDLRDPALDLEIRIEIDQENQKLLVRDTGIGMSADELKENLGTIAQSGAKAFLEAAGEEGPGLEDMIGRFGVGFYSVFMVAEWVKVSSLSFRLPEKSASWSATGADTFEIGSADLSTRGTEIEIKLKEDALEFLDEGRIRQVIKTHSDFLPYPVYLGSDKNQVNRQSAIWRESPKDVDQEEYQDLYRQLTLDLFSPQDQIHFIAEAPLMVYALLYFPAKADPPGLGLKDQLGLRLFARKILIDEHNQDLLPPYFRFIRGVVDAEDLPLNVSRENIQASAVITKIKRILTNQVIQKLKDIAKNNATGFQQFWEEFGQYIKEGVAASDDYQAELSTLLRFRTTTFPDQLSSLDDYLEHVKPGQDKIYYILGNDENSITRSPHLDYFQSHCYEVLTLTDPVDPFLLLGLEEYKGFQLQNVAAPDLVLPAAIEEEVGDQDPGTVLPEAELEGLLLKFKEILAERVIEVRTTERLTDSAARLVDAQGSPGQEIQMVYRIMDRDFELPGKVLEINPGHPLLIELNELPGDDPLLEMIIEQVFESSLLQEGLHPDPSSMLPRIEQIMKRSLGGK